MDFASLPHSLSDSESDADSSRRDSGQPAEDLWPFYSIGRPDDVLVPRDKACQEISDLLGRAHELGHSSFGEAASALPDVPGLALEGGGTVPFPLCVEVADKIAERGYQVRENVWTLAPGQVRMKNLAWTVGLQSLAETSSRRLGFDGVVLHPVLSKLMVVGAGGRIDTVQNSGNGSSVATLVVQLPSEYTGGDWVVQGAGAGRESRFDLGKVDGTAAFKPHFLVYCAEASCAVEEVTSGYCVVLIYSLYLPPELPLESCREGINLARKQLVEALKKLKGGPDDAELSGEMATRKEDEEESVILALMLSKECTQETIEAAGINSLTGVDGDRLRMLRDANALLPPGKQLVFYLARVFYDIGSLIKGLDSETWFSASGAKIESTGPGVSWTRRFSFLNPGNETLSELWECGDRKTCSLHERFALVAWPASADIGNAVTLFGDLASVPVIVSHQFISVTTLRRLLEKHKYLGFAHIGKTFEFCKGPVLLLELCLKLGVVIVELGDVTFVDAFFRKYVVHLKEKEKSLFIQWLPTLVGRFGWERVRSSLLAALDVRAQETRLSQALELADILSDNATARRDLTTFAVGKARSWSLTRPETFVSSPKLIKLLSHAMASASPPVFLLLLALLENLNGKLLGRVVDTFRTCMDDSSLPEHRAALASVATKRRQWLANEVEDSKKPFAWSIPVKDFPNAAAIEQFLLEGTDTVYEIRGFSGIAEARTQGDLLRQKIQGSVQFVASGRGRDAYVQIVKAGGDYDTRRSEVPMYEAEIVGLDKLVRDLLPQDENVNTANTNPTTRTRGLKRPREDESVGLVFE